jgi:glycosyltransferase involved in cell wall biosynthesis
VNLSLCFTTYRSSQYILKQIALDHLSLSNGLVSEIVIRDDASGDYDTISLYRSRKIRVFSNSINLGSIHNRQLALAECKNEWALMMDADNFLDGVSYDALNRIVNHSLDDKIIYCPSFAMPHFDYRMFVGDIIDMEFCRRNLMSSPSLRMFLNTGNYLVNRSRYLGFGDLIESKYAKSTVDTIYFNYLWLRSGGSFSALDGFHYYIKDTCLLR